MNSTQQQTSGAATALIFGAVGFVAGILLAPKSGRETREAIASKSTELKDKASKMKNKADESVSELKDTASTAINRTKEVASDAARDAKSTVNRAKSDAKDINSYRDS